MRAPLKRSGTCRTSHQTWADVTLWTQDFKNSRQDQMNRPPALSKLGPPIELRSGQNLDALAFICHIAKVSRTPTLLRSDDVQGLPLCVRATSSSPFKTD